MGGNGSGGSIGEDREGRQYILVIMDYTTRYPEAIPLHMAAAKGIARELFHLFSRVGIPAEILTDQGTTFMSPVMNDVCNQCVPSTNARAGGTLQ